MAYRFRHTIFELRIARVVAAGASVTVAAARQMRPCYRDVDSLALLVSEEIPDTGECEPEFRIWPRPDLSGDDIRRPKSGSRGVGNPRKMFRLGSAAEQDTKAHPVGDSLQ